MTKDRTWDVVRDGPRPARGWLHGEPTLDDLLDDSVLRALQRSDGIDPARFRIFIDELRGSARARTRRDRVGDASSAALRIPAAGER
jgi:hypothetical protein